MQLSALTSAGKDELALLVAQRKVLAFRDQDFADVPIPEILAYGSYFGRPSVHPVGPIPAAGHPEIHIAHSGGGDGRLGQAASVRTNSMIWHADGTGDPQPPGLVLLYMLECPETGGDTIFANTAAAYRQLSPAFRQRLHGLQAEHSDVDLVRDAKAKGAVARREGATAIHPVVRTHPVTGEKALFVNSLCGFMIQNVGLWNARSMSTDISTYRYYAHRGVQEGRVGSPAQIPLRSHCVFPGLSGPCPMG